MAYIDAENILIDNKTCSASVVGDVVDLGNRGGFTQPLYVDVKLTEKTSSGKMDKVTLESAPTSGFTSGTVSTEAEVILHGGTAQAQHPMTLAQFHAPIKAENRYIRLTATAASVSGGKIMATMQQGIAVPY